MGLREPRHAGSARDQLHKLSAANFHGARPERICGRRLAAPQTRRETPVPGGAPYQAILLRDRRFPEQYKDTRPQFRGTFRFLPTLPQTRLTMGDVSCRALRITANMRRSANA
jgi:hypothetical protein